MLMKAQTAQLIVVDLQERLLPAIHGGEQVIVCANKLISAAAELMIPVTVTEQYPKGLGGTVPSLTESLRASNATFLPKISFSGMADQQISNAIAGTPERRQLIVCGTETHVCVLQSAMDAQLAGYEVFVVADACSSRTQENKNLALERMRAAGITIVSTEMVLFEWLEQAGTSMFKEISKLIK
ncbi:hydrolase [Aestuariispira insulae]|uniref:Nicotinamidase-related amidase n=1 Tax=Aestuariispira insulae TaxID=1461337 RepID=A0A3D9HN55_9PROT|nr:hydrolase [Aestuariispira insulae]RED50932.1 nicotinamidase-related amidase [Aestuariispira insulae]